MQTLLRRFSEKLSHSGLHTYVTGLLLAFGTKTEPGRDSLIEPLTGREREILNLVCQGLSNQEIARQLVLSVGTVKTHMYNIFGKLGVSGRPQAIARARGLSHLNHFEL